MVYLVATTHVKRSKSLSCPEEKKQRRMESYVSRQSRGNVHVLNCRSAIPLTRLQLIKLSSVRNRQEWRFFRRKVRFLCQVELVRRRQTGRAYLCSFCSTIGNSSRRPVTTSIRFEESTHTGRIFLPWKANRYQAGHGVYYEE